MTQEILIIDENYIWVGRLEESSTVIELMKVPYQQYFLIGNDSEVIAGNFEKIGEVAVKRIQQVSQSSPYIKSGEIEILFINLN